MQSFETRQLTKRDVSVVLHPWQNTTAAFVLSRLSKGLSVIVGDGVGTGKTISVLHALGQLPKAKRVLIITTSASKFGWANTLLDKVGGWFSCPLFVFPESGKKLPSQGFVIINYDRIKKEKKLLADWQPDVVIADEAHRLKNAKAKWTKAFKTIPPTIGRVFVTGTFFQRPVDLFPILEMVDPKGLGANWMAYAQLFCAARLTNYGWDVRGSSNIPALRQALAPFYCETSTDVLGLEETFKTIFIQPQNEDHLADSIVTKMAALVAQMRCEETSSFTMAKEEYAAVVGDLLTLKKHEAFTGKLKASLFDELSTMRKVCGEAKIADAIKYINELMFEDSQQSRANPVVVFAYHSTVIDGLLVGLSKWKVGVIDGRVSATHKQKVERDHQDGSNDITIVQVKSGGEAITLTRGHTVVFVETDWTWRSLEQCIARVKRLTQTRCVDIRMLVLDNSVDKHVVRNLIDLRENTNEFRSANLTTADSVSYDHGDVAK